MRNFLLSSRGFPIRVAIETHGLEIRVSIVPLVSESKFDGFHCCAEGFADFDLVFDYLAGMKDSGMVFIADYFADVGKRRIRVLFR